MDKIRVVVQGALGRMGQEVIRALCQDDTTVAVGAVDLKVAKAGAARCKQLRAGPVEDYCG